MTNAGDTDCIFINLVNASVGENADLCAENPCKKEETEKKKKKNIIVPIVAAIGGFFILVVLVVAIFMWLKRGRKQEGKSSISLRLRD